MYAFKADKLYHTKQDTHRSRDKQRQKGFLLFTYYTFALRKSFA